MTRVTSRPVETIYTFDFTAREAVLMRTVFRRLQGDALTGFRKFFTEVDGDLEIEGVRAKVMDPAAGNIVLPDTEAEFDALPDEAR